MCTQEGKEKGFFSDTIMLFLFLSHRNLAVKERVNSVNSNKKEYNDGRGGGGGSGVDFVHKLENCCTLH